MVNKLTEFMHTKVFRYLVSGGTSFVVEYSSFLALYYLFSMSAVGSNTISFILSLITSFSLNKLWVFKSNSQSRQTSHQLVIYAVAAGCNLIITDFAIHWLVGIEVPAFAAKMLLIIAVACWNFLLFQKLIFKATPTSSTSKTDQTS